MSDLTDFRRHCRKMAKKAFTAGDTENASRWEVLAEETTKYLEGDPDVVQGVLVPTDDDVPLFGDLG